MEGGWVSSLNFFVSVVAKEVEEDAVVGSGDGEMHLFRIDDDFTFDGITIYHCVDR